MAKSKKRSRERYRMWRDEAFVKPNPVKVDAECPGCGGIFKKNVGSGRFENHAWLNGCEGPPVEGDPSPS